MDSRLRGNDELGVRNDECGGGGIHAHSRPRNIIFVPMTRPASLAGAAYGPTKKKKSFLAMTYFPRPFGAKYRGR